MEDIKTMFGEIWGWLKKPFTEQMSLPRLALWIVLFILAAFILYDGLRILKSWMATAAEAVAEAA